MHCILKPESCILDLLTLTSLLCKLKCTLHMHLLSSRYRDRVVDIIHKVYVPTNGSGTILIDTNPPQHHLENLDSVSTYTKEAVVT